MTFRSRVIGRPQWWREVTLVVVFYLVYEVVRAFVGASLSRSESDGLDLLRWEKFASHRPRTVA